MIIFQEVGSKGKIFFVIILYNNINFESIKAKEE